MLTSASIQELTSFDRRLKSKWSGTVGRVPLTLTGGELYIRSARVLGPEDVLQLRNW